MSNKMDLRISGASTMPGGDYGKVSISGSGKVDGNLRADTIRCAKFEQSPHCKKIKAAGTFSAGGDVEAEKVKLSWRHQNRRTAQCGND